jgi:hypothetical protein
MKNPNLTNIFLLIRLKDGYTKIVTAKKNSKSDFISIKTKHLKIIRFNLNSKKRDVTLINKIFLY